MIWVLYALLSAFFLATNDAISKNALQTENELLVAWVRWGLAIPFVLPLLFFIEIPILDATFWTATIILIPLELIALFLYIRAIKISPLSLTIPFLALTPVFAILTGFLILGEVLSTAGIFGILLVCAGAYTLNISKKKDGLLGPIRAIFQERGSVLMSIVALIYGLGAVLGKVVIMHSSALFVGLFYPCLLGLLTLPIVCVKTGKGITRIFKNKTFILIGALSAVMLIFHFMGLELIDVAYFISVKRLSMLFAIMYGAILFKEERITERLVGSVVMLAGIGIILLFH